MAEMSMKLGRLVATKSVSDKMSTTLSGNLSNDTSVWTGATLQKKTNSKMMKQSCTENAYSLFINMMTPMKEPSGLLRSGIEA